VNACSVVTSPLGNSTSYPLIHTLPKSNLAQNAMGGQVNAVEKAPTDQSSNQGQWGLLCAAYEEGTRLPLDKEMDM